MSVKIAFASSDRRQVDQHFGAAESFAIYELSDDDARLVEVAEFTDSDTAMDGHEGKLAAKIDLLADCAAVYCNAVGASAIKQLLARDIQPLKVEEGTLIAACWASGAASQAPAGVDGEQIKRQSGRPFRFGGGRGGKSGFFLLQLPLSRSRERVKRDLSDRVTTFGWLRGGE
jgi:nitrogen fixation protein NifX